ncbi:hypothetical protein SAMN05421771_0108 [Granulicella pectinivorans]|uniref:Opacity protein n=1 Tax=Granulicella pectinivorans TaxID=474950 RepID=A0A1I6L1B9_9BACT|nr:hypothetical protein [Granulicella pectinivorans]SFR97245.1 hypothetical protein SAMN05421771_0108 [Granulicella pectinivorans]
MTNKTTQHSLRISTLHLGLAMALAFAPSAFAQTAPTFALASVELPDAPGMTSRTEAPAGVSSSLALGESPQSSASYISARTPSMASHTDKYIEPGESAPSLSMGNKFALGFKDAFSLSSFGGWVVAAGYSQVTNGSPNYGTNATAFGKRFGAAVARASSEGVFSDSIMASVTREDPRYYRMGPGHNVIRRLGYAVTRTLITRTDSGHVSPNIALLGGNLGGSYLTKAYYPDLNTSNTEVLKTFGGSIGGSALGFAVSEFFPNINFFSFHKHND